MFSKSKINEPGPKAADTARQPAQSATPSEKTRSDSSAGSDYKPATTPKAKPPASTLSSDLTVNGNLKTTGDVNVEGTVEGDIRAHLLTIGEGATVRGEVIADDVVINGRIIGRVRGLKVRLTSTARVEGDIIHKTIAIESGAHFEGSVQRQDDPLNAKASTAAGGGTEKKPAQAAAPQQPKQQPAEAAGKS